MTLQNSGYAEDVTAFRNELYANAYAKNPKAGEESTLLQCEWLEKYPNMANKKTGGVPEDQLVFPDVFETGFVGNDAFSAAYVFDHDLGEIQAFKNYFARPDGWFHYSPPVFEGEEEKKKAVVIQVTPQLFSVVGTGDNKRTKSPELILSFFAKGGSVRRVAIPRSIIADGERALAMFLESKGFRTSADPRARKLLTSLLISLHGPIVDILDKPGWARSIGANKKKSSLRFAHPLGMFGGDDHGKRRFEFDAESLSNLHVGKKGTFKEWVRTIVEPSRGNSRLMFGLCAAVASPLLYFQNSIESRLFNLYGPSSKGKSTVSFVAGSVHGGSDSQLMFANSWHSTPAARCGWAASHSNLFGILDEMPNDMNEVASILDFAYNFSSGVDKMRKDANAKDKVPDTWRLIALSSAERAMEEMAQSHSHRQKHVAEGAQARVIDVPAIVGELGVFDTIHDHKSSRDFAESLRDAAHANYGHAGPLFIKWLTEYVNEIGEAEFRQELSEDMASFVKWLKLDNPAEVVLRVAQSFALVASAGSYAVESGVFGDDIERKEVRKACRRVFEAWLEARSGSHSIAAAQPLQTLRDWVMTNDNRLVRLDNLPSNSTKTALIEKSQLQRFAGYVKGSDYWILPSIFEKEIAGGKNAAKTLAKRLDAMDLLDVTGSERDAGRFVKKVSVPETARFYAVSDRVKSITDDGKLDGAS